MQNNDNTQPGLQTREGWWILKQPFSSVLGEDITAKALGTKQLLVRDFAFRNVRPSHIYGFLFLPDTHPLAPKPCDK